MQVWPISSRCSSGIPVGRGVDDRLFWYFWVLCLLLTTLLSYLASMVDIPLHFGYPSLVRVGPARRSLSNPVRSERKQR
jgi:hypothetical protein